MRAAAVVPLLAVSLFAQEDEWKVERPESKPEGEPVRLTFARTKDTVVRGRLTRTTTQTTPMGRETSVTDLALRMSFGDVEDGMTPIRLAIRVQRLEENGQDMTAALPEREGTLSAILEPGGKFMPGIEARGAGEMFEGDVSVLVVAGGDRTVRKGEVWEVAAGGVAERLTAVDAKDVAVESYATLEDVVERDGVRCARIRSVLVARLDGVRMGGDASGKMRLRSERTEWLGLDGILRHRTETLKARILAGGVAFDMDVESEVDAGPETKEEEAVESGGPADGK